MATVKLPKKALYFNEHNEGFAKATDDKEFEMVAYSGKVIKDHFWWGDLIISLEGMKFEKPKYPILEQHDVSKKIGFVKRPKPENELRFNDITYVETKESQEFRDLSKQGFPFEASIRAQPTKITRLSDGEKQKVNGMMFKGPGTIWEESIFKEASVTVFGYDSKTKSQAFDEEGEVELEVEQLGGETAEENKDEPNKGGKSIMNKEQLKADHPELFEEVVGEGEAKARLEFTSEKENLETQNTELKGTVTELSKTVTTQGEEITALQQENEKREALQLEADLKKQAGDIWTDKLSNSDVPDYMHDKCRKMISHQKFVKEDVLDTEAFGKAVDVEIKDWESRTKDDTETDGFGTSHKKEEHTAKEDSPEDIKKWENEMAALAGVELMQ